MGLKTHRIKKSRNPRMVVFGFGDRSSQPRRLNWWEAGSAAEAWRWICRFGETSWAAEARWLRSLETGSAKSGSDAAWLWVCDSVRDEMRDGWWVKRAGARRDPETSRERERDETWEFENREYQSKSERWESKSEKRVRDVDLVSKKKNKKIYIVSPR